VKVSIPITVDWWGFSDREGKAVLKKKYKRRTTVSPVSSHKFTPQSPQTSGESLYSKWGRLKDDTRLPSAAEGDIVSQRGVYQSQTKADKQAVNHRHQGKW